MHQGSQLQRQVHTLNPVSHKEGAGTQNKSNIEPVQDMSSCHYPHGFQLEDKKNRVSLAEGNEENGRTGLLAVIFRSASTKPVCLRSDIDAIVIGTERHSVQSFKDKH